MKKVNILICIFLTAVLFSSCAFQDEWPDTYENIEWEEITREHAIQIWGGYDTTTMRHCSLTIWEKWLGTSPQKWIGCSIGGDSYENADGNIILLCIGNLTTFPQNEPEGAIFYQKKGDSSIIRIENPPNNGNGDYKIDIYENGWAVTKKTYDTAFSRYDFFFIKYAW